MKIKYILYKQEYSSGISFYAQWYWHAKSANNRTQADGSEGYNHFRDALRGMISVCNLTPHDCDTAVFLRLKPNGKLIPLREYNPRKHK